MELHKTHLLELFKARNIKASKTLGQNFLLDKNFLDFIIRTADLTSDDLVLEIGSGPGILTHLLAEKAKYVWAVEIDHNLYSIAQDLYGQLPNVKFIRSNFLAKDRYEINSEVLSVLDAGGIKSLKVVSNLPYKTAVPIILSLLESHLPISSMLLMIQLEIAQRITAETGAHNYSSVSILCNFLSHNKKIKKVPPEVFWPRPEVFSSLIYMTPTHRFTREFFHHDYRALKRFLKMIFSYRRKTILRSLQNVFSNLNINQEQSRIEKLLVDSLLDSSLRPQKITPEQYLLLFNNFRNNIFDLAAYLDNNQEEIENPMDKLEDDQY